MVRRLAWTALYGIIGALATLAARKAAAGIWRIATGEHPPTRRK